MGTVDSRLEEIRRRLEKLRVTHEIRVSPPEMAEVYQNAPADIEFLLGLIKGEQSR